MKTFRDVLELLAAFVLVAIGGWHVGHSSMPPPVTVTVTQPEQPTQAEPNTATYRVTAYCPCEKCCGKYSDNITASGYQIRPGDKFCASPLPFLTVLDIPGYGVVPVLDRGGAITEGRIDVFFSTHQAALEFGVQYLDVTILE